jgi:tetratricopeptide (TPR) repeat protein
MKMVLGLGAVAAAAIALGGQAWAQGAIEVASGGLASDCAAAVKANRFSNQDEKLCTSALENELLTVEDRAGTYVNRGIMRMRQKDYDGALKDFNTGIHYKADLAEAYVNRGATEIALKDYRRALADLDQSLQLSVKEPEKAYYNRALARDWLDDTQGAYLDFQKAQALAPLWDLPREQLVRFKQSHPEYNLPDAPAPAAAPGKP